jgi:hypothetical protein
MATTLVTAYYNIDSIKYSDAHKNYMIWGNNLLKLETNIILFTEEYLVSEIKKMRENKPIEIICIPFQQLETWKLYKEKWIEHNEKDPEKSIHIPELYSLWAEKVFFVEKAIELNPYNTEYFFWCDFGGFRDLDIPFEIINSFPSSKYLPKDKIILQSLKPLEINDKIKGIDNIYGPEITHEWNDIRIVGGFWGGGIEGCLNWKKYYKKTLEKYFNSNRFAGKDQIIMLSTYLEYPNLAIVIEPTIYNINAWYFLKYLLSDLNVYFKIEESYKI